MAARLTLVLGGQRSGKSLYAERAVLSTGRAPVYLATASAGDAEMAERIEKHRFRRGSAWRVHEEALDIARALHAACTPGACVLLDCLALWVSNLLGCGRNPAAEADRLVATLGEVRGEVVIVSNEVGSGIVPANALARRYADDLGQLNQRIAAVADEVVLMVAGLPLFLKRREGPPE
jgi:adenosylcobinamide kinase/adenosylcobinamide-phosphate guanylyltransferase